MVQKPLIKQGYSLAEEIANSVSHGIGLVFGIVGLVLLLVQAVDLNASATAITSYSLYGGSMILLFLASTLYHAIPHQRAKMWLKKFDHCAIYLLIAGTYTPVCVIAIRGAVGYGMLVLIWAIALAGIIFKAFWVNCPKWVSSVLYIGMGWVCLLAFTRILNALPTSAFLWLLAGGIIYTVGGIIYAMKLPVFNGRHKNFGSHEIFHLFVMGGSFCHFIVMYILAAMPIR